MHPESTLVFTSLLQNFIQILCILNLLCVNEPDCGSLNWQECFVAAFIFHRFSLTSIFPSKDSRSGWTPSLFKAFPSSPTPFMSTIPVSKEALWSTPSPFVVYRPIFRLPSLVHVGTISRSSVQRVERAWKSWLLTIPLVGRSIGLLSNHPCQHNPPQATIIMMNYDHCASRW